MREKLRATAAAAVRGRAYDVVAHQQAAMPEQLLPPEPADPEHDDQEQKPGRREAPDLAALRALRESRTDVEPSMSPPNACATSRTRSARRPTGPTPR
ncbi:hypothetical protein [Streptomyces cyaneofuscatus]|uniref:hypothetical protein n=1 Tax=Streptomyces cyaneofuscatus TaxID=66883 RepID=UPI00381EC65D